MKQVIAKIFRMFFGEKPPKQEEQESAPPIVEIDLAVLGSLNYKDYLGKAAQAEECGLAAVKRGDYDAAWKHFHEQKQHYLGHASQSEFTKAQTFALDASVSEHLANILRLEGKHQEAFAHIVYWVATSPRRTKNQEKKLTTYFKRAKCSKAHNEDLESFLAQARKSPNLRQIQNKIQEWQTDA